jgi:hypothetical protein
MSITSGFVLGRLRAHQLYAKLSKCEFWLEKIAFLGHILTVEGIEVDPSRSGIQMEVAIQR